MRVADRPSSLLGVLVLFMVALAIVWWIGVRGPGLADALPRPAAEVRGEAGTWQAGSGPLVAGRPGPTAGERKPVRDARRASPAPRNARISGTVVDSSGSPVAQAHVGLFPEETAGAGPEANAIAMTETDAQGRFRLSARGSDFVLVAASPSRRPATRRLRATDASDAEVELVLEDGLAISGRVTDRGAPIRGAMVSVDLAFGVPGLFGNGEELFWIEGRVETKHRSAITGADGSFHLDGLGSHDHTLFVFVPRETTHPDGAAVLQRVVRPPSEQADVEFNATELRISVKSTAAGSVPRQVSVAGKASETYGVDPGGMLRLWVAPEQRYTISVADAQGFAIEVPPLFPGETREVVLEPGPLQPWELFRGIVVDDAGQPLPGAHVGLFPMEGAGPGSNAITAVETDESGRFSVCRSDGPCLLVAATSGRRPASLWVDGAMPQQGIRLVLDRGFALSGVLRKNGRPEAGVLLQVDLAFGVPGLFGCGPELFWKNGRVETKHGMALTGVDGRYEMTGLGPYVHRLDLVGAETVNIEVPSFAADFDLVGRQL